MRGSLAPNRSSRRGRLSCSHPFLTVYACGCWEEHRSNVVLWLVTWGTDALPIAVGHNSVQHVGLAAPGAGQEQRPAAVLLADPAVVLRGVACSGGRTARALARNGGQGRFLDGPRAPAVHAEPACACPPLPGTQVSSHPPRGAPPAQISVFQGLEKLVGPSSLVQVSYVSIRMVVCSRAQGGLRSTACSARTWQLAASRSSGAFGTGGHV